MAGTTGQQPGFAQAFTLFNVRTPEVYADIDRTKAEQLGVPISRVFETLSVYMGSAFVNDFNILGRTYRVTAQADNPFRLSLRDVASLKTRNSNGDMVPIGSVATFNDTTGAYRVPRYNLYPAAEVQVQLQRGYSTGTAIEVMEKITEKVLPAGFGFEWTEIALQEKLAGNTAIFAFVLSVVFVFLLLSALYESWLLPLAVILIVPMCILAAMIGVNIRGLDRNILVEIGLIVLVGLAAKNAILIVEFAKQGEDQGLPRSAAAVEAARTRLRPILMTSLLHSRRRAAGVCNGCRRRDAPIPRHGRLLRHARRDAIRPDLYAGLLCAGPQFGRESWPRSAIRSAPRGVVGLDRCPDIARPRLARPKIGLRRARACANLTRRLIFNVDPFVLPESKPRGRLWPIVSCLKSPEPSVLA